MKFFLSNKNINYVLLMFFILNSCTTYSKKFTQKSKTTELYTPNFLISKNIEKILKIDIDVYGHELGGLLVIKKIDFRHYRIALITEIGAKLLDFELINNEMKLNYAIEQLNRKIILNILKQDFLILLNEKSKIELEYTLENQDIYQTSFKNKKLYYFVANDSKMLKKTVLASNQKEKISFYYNYLNNQFPDIKIDHNNIKLKINLRLLDDK